VLAGAISWGFKSPSPHHISGFRINKIRKPFSFVPKTCPKTPSEHWLSGAEDEKWMPFFDADARVERALL
jgi:hypothetical protein